MPLLVSGNVKFDEVVDVKLRVFLEGSNDRLIKITRDGRWCMTSRCMVFIYLSLSIFFFNFLQVVMILKRIQKFCNVYILKNYCEI